ncbi:MAG TPA: hypothetical protein VMO26_27415 [Vicinamibacterales bacterium]|nr:hypothetical protein [Vicinamibacterales bacterium]
MQRDLRPRVAVVVGYVCLAIAFSWPLPLHLGTALTGDPGGDTGVYVWNQWVFQHETLVEHTNPLRTDHILATTEPVDLSQHNYTVFLNLLALPLIPFLGVVQTFNVVLLLVSVLTALCTYALARRVTSATRFEAWLAGFAFAWCPALVARSAGHFSLVAAAPLAAFILCLINADRSRRSRDAALAGLCMAWAGFSDPYYAVYCLIIAAVYVGARVMPITFSSQATSAPSFESRRSIRTELRWVLNVAIVIVSGLVVGLLVGPGGRFDLLGIPISVRGLYTPVFILTMLVLVRLALDVRPRVLVRAVHWSPIAVRLLVVGSLVCVGLLSPILYGLAQRIIDGRLVTPPTLWRSSPRGVDLLGLFEFNPNHVLARAFGDRQLADGAAFVEYTAAFSLVALTVVALAAWRGGYRPPSGWIWLTAGFAALSLGPFIYVAGFNTHVPGPWSVLRYVPLIDAARTPTRFSIVAALGLAIMLAGALAALGRRFPPHRRVVAGTVGVFLVLELAPVPRTLYSASIPSVYQTIADDPRPVRVLHLPFGVRDGTFSAGDFSARHLFYQTQHGKQLIGGYLSRISEKRVRGVRAQPTLEALVVMSEGGTLAPPHAAWIRARGPRFIARANVGYVVVDETRAPPYLVEFAVSAWALEEIGRDGALTLYRPRPHTP